MPRKYVVRRRPRVIRRRKGMRKPMGKVMRAIRKVDRKGSQIIYLTNRVPATAVGSTTGLSNTSPYFYHVNNLQVSTPCFGTVASDTEANKLYHRYTNIRVRFSLEGEDDPQKFTMFFVRMTKFAQRLLNFPSGALNALTSNIDFIDPATLTTNDVGLLQLSPKYFKVLYRKTFDSKLSWFNTPDNTTNMTGEPSQYTWTKNFRIKSRYLMHNPDGDAVDLPMCNVPQNNWFILVFSDNSTTDLASPTIDVNEVSSWISST